jgi:hypothetical protein
MIRLARKEPSAALEHDILPLSTLERVLRQRLAADSARAGSGLV